MATVKTIPGKKTEFVELHLTRAQYALILSALWAAGFTRDGKASPARASVEYLYDRMRAHVPGGGASSANAFGIYRFPFIYELGEVKAPALREVAGAPRFVLEMTKDEAQDIYDELPYGGATARALASVLK